MHSIVGDSSGNIYVADIYKTTNSDSTSTRVSQSIPAMTEWEQTAFMLLALTAIALYLKKRKAQT